MKGVGAYRLSLRWPPPYSRRRRLSQRGRPRQIGTAALDVLIAMLHRNERGVLTMAQHILVDGVWLNRNTTRQVGPPTPWFLDEPVPAFNFSPKNTPAGTSFKG